MKTSNTTSQLSYVGNINFDSIPKADLKLDKLLPSQSHFTQIIDSTFWFSSIKNHSVNTEPNRNSVYAHANLTQMDSLADLLNMPSSFRGRIALSLGKEIEFSLTPVGKQVTSKLVVTFPDSNKNSLIYLVTQFLTLN